MLVDQSDRQTDLAALYLANVRRGMRWGWYKEEEER